MDRTQRTSKSVGPIMLAEIASEPIQIMQWAESLLHIYIEFKSMQKVNGLSIDLFGAR